MAWIALKSKQCLKMHIYCGVIPVNDNWCFKSKAEGVFFGGSIHYSPVVETGTGIWHSILCGILSACNSFVFVKEVSLLQMKVMRILGWGQSINVIPIKMKTLTVYTIVSWSNSTLNNGYVSYFWSVYDDNKIYRFFKLRKKIYKKTISCYWNKDWLRR